MRTEFIHLPKVGATICLGYIEEINGLAISMGFAKNFTSRENPRDGFNRRIGRNVTLGRLRKSIVRKACLNNQVFWASVTDDFEFLKFARELRDRVNNISFADTERRNGLALAFVTLFFEKLGLKPGDAGNVFKRMENFVL